MPSGRSEKNVKTFLRAIFISGEANAASKNAADYIPIKLKFCLKKGTLLRLFNHR
jgi:hypothetical protein